MDTHTQNTLRTGLNTLMSLAATNLTVQTLSTAMNGYGDVVQTVTDTRTIEAIVQKYDITEDQIRFGMDSTICFVAYVRPGDLNTTFDDEPTYHQAIYDGTTYACKKASTGDLGTTESQIYMALLLKRLA